MVDVTPDSVRERINISAAECPDAVVTRFIVDATETVELETGLTIDYTDCTAQEAVAIRNLAAMTHSLLTNLMKEQQVDTLNQIKRCMNEIPRKTELQNCMG